MQTSANFFCHPTSSSIKYDKENCRILSVPSSMQEFTNAKEKCLIQPDHTHGAQLFLEIVQQNIDAFDKRNKNVVDLLKSEPKRKKKSVKEPKMMNNEEQLQQERKKGNELLQQARHEFNEMLQLQRNESKLLQQQLLNETIKWNEKHDKLQQNHDKLQQKIDHLDQQNEQLQDEIVSLKLNLSLGASKSTSIMVIRQVLLEYNSVQGLPLKMVQWKATAANTAAHPSISLYHEHDMKRFFTCSCITAFTWEEFLPILEQVLIQKHGSIV